MTMRLQSSSLYGIPTKRTLRTRNDQTKDNGEQYEARGISPTAVESLTKSNSFKVDSELLQKWLDGGKSTDEVFKLLKLDNVVDNVLAHPKLQSYLDYMRIIQAAKADDATAKVAKQLEVEQIQRWLLHEKTPDDIFDLLKLDQMRYDLFEKPELLTWVKYVDEYNKMYPKREVSLFENMRPLVDESALVPMLITAKGISSTERIALRVQAEQTTYWLKTKKTPENIFLLLRLDKEEGNLLANPIFDAWIKYADDFRDMYPKESLNAIAMMEDFFTKQKIASMIADAANSPNTKTLAHRLNTEQLNNWITSKKSPVALFSDLELTKAGDKIFQDPVISIWLKYVELYNEKMPKNKRTSVVYLLKNRFGFERLGGMLVDVEKNGGSISTSQVSKMLDSLSLRMATNTVKPEEMYKWLHVEDRPITDKIRQTYNIYKEKYAKALAEAKARAEAEAEAMAMVG
ncbi:RxLR effector protein [Phytophthora megakarya]|uniref:RxLR effector protein n=1 Tax=Phytophthora megakarya TaxID=4795 RepID=A0A225WKD1_9STRA|nr:RxLR effector protein [Phytophthora megakarya]